MRKGTESLIDPPLVMGAIRWRGWLPLDFRRVPGDYSNSMIIALAIFAVLWLIGLALGQGGVRFIFTMAIWAAAALALLVAAIIGIAKLF